MLEGGTSSSASVTSDVTPHAKNSRKRGRDVDVDVAILKSLKQIEERRERREEMRGQREVLDEEDHFACQIATTLHRLPDRRRALAKIQIQQLLFNLEFSEADASPPPSLYNF